MQFLYVHLPEEVYFFISWWRVRMKGAENPVLQKVAKMSVKASGLRFLNIMCWNETKHWVEISNWKELITYTLYILTRWTNKTILFQGNVLSQNTA